jgi:hypothetical protein
MMNFLSTVWIYEFCDNQEMIIKGIILSMKFEVIWAIDLLTRTLKRKCRGN